MKGTLTKTEKVWFVQYMAYDKTPIGHKSWWERLPLYPLDHTTNKTQEIEGKEVEFEIVDFTYTIGNTPFSFKCAKLINVDKLGNEDVPKLGYCINCDEQKLTHEICMDCIGKIIKENQVNLYTEEQVREAMVEICKYATELSELTQYPTEEECEKRIKSIIQSLKQPKK